MNENLKKISKKNGSLIINDSDLNPPKPTTPNRPAKNDDLI